MVLRSWTPWNYSCFWFGNRSCSFLNRNCFRCSLEPSCFDRYVCKQTFVIKRPCQLYPWQVVGAFLASAAVFFLLANSGMSTASLGENALANGVTVFGGFLFETIATFLFVLVIMTVTSASKGNGAIAGLVIGLSLTALILAGLNVTGLSVNPARSLAPAVLVGGAALQQVWIFILAPIVGGVLAALVAKNFLGTEE